MGKKKQLGQDHKPDQALHKRKESRSGARAEATLRGPDILNDDLRAAGGALSLEQVEALLGGISRKEINERVRNNAMLAVPGLRNRLSFPAAQFLPNGAIVQGLSAVANALPTRNPWVVLNFLVQPDERLFDERPIDLLRKGKIDLVVEAARRLAEQGA